MAGANDAVASCLHGETRSPEGQLGEIVTNFLREPEPLEILPVEASEQGDCQQFRTPWVFPTDVREDPLALVTVDGDKNRLMPTPN